jgi:hypothetical protein
METNAGVPMHTLTKPIPDLDDSRERSYRSSPPILPIDCRWRSAEEPGAANWPSRSDRCDSLSVFLREAGPTPSLWAGSIHSEVPRRRVCSWHRGGQTGTSAPAATFSDKADLLCQSEPFGSCPKPDQNGTASRAKFYGAAAHRGTLMCILWVGTGAGH